MILPCLASPASLISSSPSLAMSLATLAVFSLALAHAHQGECETGARAELSASVLLFFGVRTRAHAGAFGRRLEHALVLDGTLNPVLLGHDGETLPGFFVCGASFSRDLRSVRSQHAVPEGRGQAEVRVVKFVVKRVMALERPQ